MRHILAKLSTGIAVLLIAGVCRAQAPVLAGTPEGETHRKALLSAVEDWKTFLPANQSDPLTQKYQPALHKIKDDASLLTKGEPVDPLEKRFADWKQALLTELYKGNEQRFFSDPSRFSEFMQERLDALSAIRNQKARAPQNVKQLDNLAAQINTLPDRAQLDKIYDKVGAGKASFRAAAIRQVSFTAPAPAGVTGTSTNYSPDRVSPPPTFEPASYTPVTADGFSLSNIISSVSKTAKKYAGKVADAIVNFSRSLNLDEKLQAAVIWAESAFNPHATSESGAMGLGQLMPGTARGLRVSNAYDIDQNVKGSTRFLRDRLDHFTDADQIKYMQGLYAWGKTRVQRGEDVEAVWKDVFAKTPLGVKNALASYNAGQGAIDKYAGGDYRNLPVKHTAYAESHNVGYWQTIHYVPSVLRRYFEISLRTSAKPSPNAPISI